MYLCQMQRYDLFHPLLNLCTLDIGCDRVTSANDSHSLFFVGGFAMTPNIAASSTALRDLDSKVGVDFLVVHLPAFSRDPSLTRIINASPKVRIATVFNRKRVCREMYLRVPRVRVPDRFVAML